MNKNILIFAQSVIVLRVPVNWNRFAVEFPTVFLGNITAQTLLCLFQTPNLAYKSRQESRVFAQVVMHAY